jgi:hypothetical protein
MAISCGVDSVRAGVYNYETRKLFCSLTLKPVTGLGKSKCCLTSRIIIILYHTSYIRLVASEPSGRETSTGTRGTEAGFQQSRAWIEAR